MFFLYTRSGLDLMGGVGSANVFGSVLTSVRTCAFAMVYLMIRLFEWGAQKGENSKD